MGEEQISNTLKDFGLTDKEILIYIFLAKHSLLKGSDVSKYTKTNKAEVYRVLRNLQNKGLIEPTLQSPTRYAAVSLEKIIDHQIKTKQDEATKIEKARKELMNYWSALSHTEIEPLPQKLVVIEGKKRVFSKISQMIRETNHQFSIISSFRNLMQAYEHGLFDSFLDQLKKSAITARLLTEIPQNHLGSAKKLFHELNTTGVEFQVRTPELGLRLFPRIVIRDNEESALFISPNGANGVEQDYACIWTNSKEIAQAFEIVFEDLWKNSIDLEHEIAQIEKGQSPLKHKIINDPEAARQKYEESLCSARKEIVIMTSSTGLLNLYRNLPQLEKWVNIGVSVKIMAPVTNENLKAAQQLNKLCNVKHVPLSYLVTAIIDGTFLFQAKTQDTTDFKLGEAFYTNSHETVKRTQAMLKNIWELASTPTSATVKSFLNSPPTPIITPNAIREFQNKMKACPPEGLPKGFLNSGLALIHPPPHLNIPAMAIRILSYTKESSFGEGNSLDVRLLLQGPKDYSFVQVAAANTNSKAAVPEKAILAGCPASDNYQIVKPEQLQIRREGNALFCGWTFPIPLPPTKNTLPPAALLIEGYGEPRHSRVVGSTPSGYRLISESDAFDAFVTFIDPFWKYNGPGSQGQVCLNSTMTVIPP